MESKGFLQIEIIDVLVSSACFIWIPISRVKNITFMTTFCFTVLLFQRGDRRQNLTVLTPKVGPRDERVNPLIAGAAYIRVFIFYQHIKYHLFNMLKIK